MYYLGLDYGGTKIKTALYDEAGTEIGIAVQPSQVDTSMPRVVEIDREGRPCGKGILSSDTRSIGLIQSWREQKLNKALYPYILQEIWPFHPLASLAISKQRRDTATRA